MYRQPNQEKRPDPPPGDEDEPGRDTMPATLGSRLRARAALQATEAAPNGTPAGPRPQAGGAPDLTRWLALAGLGVFGLLFLAAAALFVLAQFREPVALPTPLDPTAAVAAASETALPAATEAASPAADTPAPPPTAEPTLYTVQPNDTLSTIAEDFGVTVQEILDANPQITDPNQVVIGAVLVIPISPTAAAQVTPPATAVTPITTAEPTAGTAANLPRSIYEGDLAAAYPLTLAGPRVTIHYQPGSFTDTTGPDIILNNAEETLAFIEQRLEVTYADPFDVYFAGSLFAAPDQHLRGRAFSTQHRAFVLYDGSGTPAERRYMLSHEMTHVVAWNTYGVPSTVMLSEGMATYSGQPYLDQGGFIPYQDFCQALAEVNRLPSIASIQNSQQAFLGHIRSLFNYNTAGCFVGFLFERGGVPAVEALYPTSNYTGNFGAGLGQLEIEFQQGLTAGGEALAFDPAALVAYYDEVQAGYDQLLSDPSPDMPAYFVLDGARLAVVTGDFATARSRLDEFEAMMAP
jgi:LysM repeat protein